MKDRSSVVSRLKLGSVVAVFSLSLMGGRGAYGVTDFQKCAQLCNTQPQVVNGAVASREKSQGTSAQVRLPLLVNFIAACMAYCVPDSSSAVASVVSGQSYQSGPAQPGQSKGKSAQSTTESVFGGVTLN